ncbi:MAG TPA: hypothetical protein ENH84_07410 [Phycisphaerae bacterium]|nr:hypothetical protein [Phycisphaerae bacterium]
MTHYHKTCRAKRCDRPINFPSTPTTTGTGDLCLVCWTRERVEMEVLERKSIGRGGNRSAQEKATKTRKKREYRQRKETP